MVNTRMERFKTVLWFILGMAAVVAAARFLMGLGATTDLSDKTPWGVWIGFDVISGVALAAGGFVVAAAVYIFHLEKYHSIARPAVLTAFLGYAAVIVGLMFDVGLPWHIWSPIINWQHHSALFEVAWCVMLYFTVLALEFSPVVFENSKYQGIYKFLKKLTIPLVIIGIMLSTMHQSSLGTMLVIMPHRIPEIFYSPIQYGLFFISAIALGLMMVTFESHLTSYLYKREHETDMLEGLGRAARWALLLYLAVRFGDLAGRGVLALIGDGSVTSLLFILEILLMAVIPVILLFIDPVRKSTAGQVTIAAMVVIGVVFNRMNVSGLSMVAITQTSYIPSWMEVVISAGVVSGAGLLFFFFQDNFPVHGHAHGHEPANGNGSGEPVADADLVPVTFTLSGFDHATGVWLGDNVTARRRYSLAFVLAMAVTFAILPKTALSGIQKGLFNPVKEAMGGDIMTINGNRSNYSVTFDHKKHSEETAPGKCQTCHHVGRFPDKNTACADCHADMIISSSIFNHLEHQQRLGGNQSCTECHKPGEARAEMSTPCATCHEGAFPKDAVNPMAPGYKDAMHGTCIECHQKEGEKLDKPMLGKCSTCHP